MDNSSIKPVILNVGKKGRKSVKRLKRGEGPVVEQAVAAAANAAVAQGKGPEEVIPVVILYRKRPKQKTKLSLANLLPLM